MGVYDGVASRAASLIARKGAAVVFTRKGQGQTKDPVTQGVTAGAADQVFTRYAVGLPPSSSWTVRDKTLVLTGKVELFVGPVGYAPLKSDDVLWEGAHWAICDWTEYRPDGGGSVLLRILIE